MTLNLVITVLLSSMSAMAFLIAFWVYLQGGKTQTNLLFIIIALNGGAWIAAVIWFHFLNTLNNTFSLSLPFGLTFIIAATLWLAIALFSYGFPEDNITIKPIVVYVLVFFYLVVILITIFGYRLWVSEEIVRLDQYSFQYTPGPLYNLYTLFAVSYFVITIVNFIKQSRKTTDLIKRAQLKFVMWGLGIAMLFGILFDIIFPIYLDIVTDWIARLGASIFIIFTFYAITKHNLFNIKAIATELLIFALWLFLFIRIFTASDIQGVIVNGVLFSTVVVFGGFLIKSVLNEVNQREELERASTKLKDLKGNLETKVKEQTVEIRRAYEVEKKARIELEDLDKAKDQFILTTQHHLRTPLTIIKGHIDILKSKPYLSEEAKKLVGEISQSTDIISKAVNNLLQTTEIKMREQLSN